MNRVSLLREQLKQAEQFVFMTVGDVTPEQAHWTPPGMANPLGATLAHLVLGEDAFVQGMFKGATPLAAGSWAGKVGLSEPPPPPFPPTSWYDWGRKVQWTSPHSGSSGQRYLLQLTSTSPGSRTRTSIV